MPDISFRTGRFSGQGNLTPRGTRICQCPLCFELFSGESTFVLHRTESARVGGNPGAYFLTECRDPASKGMRLSPTGVWSLPLPATSPLAVGISQPLAA